METQDALNMLWVLISTALVFLMQAGFGCLETGATRAKNSINVAIKNLIDLTLSCMMFWLVGYGLMFGASAAGIVGTDGFFFSIENYQDNYIFLFQMVFCGTATTIVSGAVAERMSFSGYLIAAVINSILIYPLFGHWVWNGDGFLASWGFVDFAGSTVVHSIGGWVALAAIIVIGARKGRFNEDGSLNKINGSSLPMAVLGAIILWFGWIGFNGGSTLELNQSVPGIILNTIIAGAAGGLIAVFSSWYFRKRPECEPLVNGSLAGLVAITANCHAVEAWEAVCIGGVGGLLMLGCEWALIKARLDDAVGAIPVHLAAGIWGTIAVALFGNPETLGTGLGFWAQLGVQTAGVTIAGVWAFGWAILLLGTINKFHSMRVTDEQEYMGLNVTEHGATTEILDFFRVMDEQERTGDLSLRVPEEPFTEVGQIAGKYNRVLGRVEESANELTSAKAKTEHILRSVGEGLLVVESDLTLGTECSDAAKALLGRDDLAGMHVVDALFPDKNGPLSQEKLRQEVDSLLATGFSLLIADQFSDLVKNAPKSLRFPAEEGSDKPRIYRLNYSPLIVDDEVTKIVLVVSDETELAALRNTVTASYRKIGGALGHIQSLFSDDVDRTGLMQCLKEISPLAEDAALEIDKLSPSNIDHLFRMLHTIKGGTRLFNLEFLQHFAHESESALGAVRDGVMKLDDLDRHELKDHVQTMRDGLRSINGLIESMGQGETRDDIEQSFKFFSETLKRSVKKLSKDLDKKADLAVDSDFAIQGRDLGIMQKAIVHILRNSLDHGIEAEDVRTEKGKPLAGQIQINLAVEGKYVEVDVIDDGQGINRDAVIGKGLDLGLITDQQAENKSDEAILGILTAPGFSTKSEVTDVSGRGVGLDAVNEELKNHEGVFSLVKSDGEGTHFRLKWKLCESAVPREHARQPKAVDKKAS